MYKNEHLLMPNTGLIRRDLRILEQYESEGTYSTSEVEEAIGRLARSVWEWEEIVQNIIDQ